MSDLWQRITSLLGSIPARSLDGLARLIEIVRGTFLGDPVLRRRVAFSIAMIALSAKMAKADGVVTQAEVRAFYQIFEIPPEEMRNVARLFDLAKTDIAGFEIYAAQLAGLCSERDKNCRLLEDVLDGLFHIAKADGVLHDRETDYLQRVAAIFHIDEVHFHRIMARHVIDGSFNPYDVLGLQANSTFDEVRKRYRKLVFENHPDRLIARGMPQDFISIATNRLATINNAFEMIEKRRVPA